MSTYSPSLRIQLITTGDQAGVWGTTTNTNLGTLIESAIAGYTSVSITSANQALTALNGAADQSRNMTIALTTTTAAAFAVYAPPAEKTYVIYNTSAYAATIYNSTVLGNTTAAGAGVVVPAGKTMTVWSDGTNFALQNTHLIGTVVGNVTGNVTGNLNGGVTATGTTSTLAATFPNAGEVCTVSATAATGTINFDVTTQSVLYYTTNASGNWTVNFRGSSGTSLNTLLAVGQSVTVAFMATQGTTAYYNSAVQVDGVSVTPKYLGAAPFIAGNASGIDVYTYTVLKTAASTYTVLATQTRYA